MSGRTLIQPGTAAVLAALVLASACLSACGGSTKASSSSKPAESTSAKIDRAFVARADAVCQHAASKNAAHGSFPFTNFDPQHPDAKSLPRVGAYFAEVQAVDDRVPVELARLGQPQTGQSSWRELLSLAGAERRLADRQIAAAKASDADAFVATVNPTADAHNRLAALAKAAAFSSPACGQLF